MRNGKNNEGLGDVPAPEIIEQADDLVRAQEEVLREACAEDEPPEVLQKRVVAARKENHESLHAILEDDDPDDEETDEPPEEIEEAEVVIGAVSQEAGSPPEVTFIPPVIPGEGVEEDEEPAAPPAAAIPVAFREPPAPLPYEGPEAEEIDDVPDTGEDDDDLADEDGKTDEPVEATETTSSEVAETEESDEADETVDRELLAVRFSELTDDLLRYSKELPPESEPTFRIITVAEVPEAIITQLEPSEEEDAEPVRMAFSTSNPDEKVPVDELPPDSPWHGSPHDERPPETTEYALNKNTPAIIKELAHVAPDQGSLLKLVEEYDDWLANGEPSRPDMPSNRETLERTDVGRHLLLGAMQQYDIAKEQGETIDVGAVAEPVMHILIDNFGRSASIISTENLITATIHGAEAQSNLARHEWHVSREAGCAMALALEVNDLSKGNLLFDNVVRSGMVFREPEIAEAFHAVVMGDRGEEFLARVAEPMSVAEDYMTKVLEAYSDDTKHPERYQKNVNGLLNLHHPGRPGRIAAIEVLDFDQKLGGQAAGGGRSVMDFALTGEAFLSLLDLTRSEDPEIRARQYEEDQRHAEIVGSFAGQIPSRKMDAALAERYFGRPDLNEEDRRAAIQQYAAGAPPQQLYASHRRRTRAAKAAYGESVRSGHDIHRPGYGKLS